jgi:uncharacterized protein YerC
MNPSLKRQLLQTFIQMLDDLNGQKELEMFLKDFFDDSELTKYVKRLATVYWLKMGRDNQNIKRNLKATSKEITEAKKLLKKEGITLALKKIEADKWADEWARRIKRIAKS